MPSVSLPTKERLEVLKHPACSPDLLSSNFHTSVLLKEALKGLIFTSNNHVHEAVV